MNHQDTKTDHHRGAQSQKLVVGSVAPCLIAAWVALCASAALAHKPTLTIALDDSPRSRMLRRELTRDWTQPNPALKLTRSQKRELQMRGTQLNAIATRIDDYFHVVYVMPDAPLAPTVAAVAADTPYTVPLSVRFHLPAVRINRGAWETLDRRAFAFEGRPLVTIDWYRARHASISRDVPRAPGGDYWAYCSEEGWSGSENVETPAPWERTNPFPNYE